jgi:predicted Zn-dependent protease
MSGPGQRNIGVRTVLVLSATGLVIAAMAAADAFLVRLGETERQTAAASLYKRAETLTASGDPDRALDYYRLARNQMRDDQKYRLAFVQALQRVGRLEEAEAEARRMLLEHSAAGPLNLILARILAARKRPDDAAWFYHRALYGNWSENSDSERLSARLELADLLARKGATEQVVAEVLLLLNDADAGKQLRERSADLLLKAGSFQRAAALYRELLRENPKQANLHAGLGLALFTGGQVRRSRTELAIASDLEPANTEVRRKLEIAQNYVELDPAARGIGSVERTRRSRRLLQIAVATIQACGVPDEARTSVDESTALLANRRRRTSEPDRDVALAGDIWRAMPSTCKTSAESEAVTMLFEEARQ